MENKITNIISTFTKFPNLVTPESLLVENLGLDSLQFMTMISHLEDEFDISITSRRLSSIKYVADVITVFTHNLELQTN